MKWKGGCLEKEGTGGNGVIKDEREDYKLNLG